MGKRRYRNKTIAYTIEQVVSGRTLAAVSKWVDKLWRGPRSNQTITKPSKINQQL